MAAYRRFRIGVFATDGGGVVSIENCELRTSVGGADITGSGSASASSTYPGSSAAYAFDGAGGTRWTSNGAASGAGEYLEYDLGAGNEAEVVEFLLQAPSWAWWAEAPNTFWIAGSNDGTQWTVLRSYFGQTGWGNSENRVFSAVPTEYETEAYIDAVLALSPTAHYRLNETSGTTAEDSSGNSNDGAYNGTYSLADDPIVPGAGDGKSVSLTDAYVSTPAFDLSNKSFTIAGWVLPTTLDTYNFFYTNRHSDAGNRNLHTLFRADGTVDLRYYYDDFVTRAGLVVQDALTFLVFRYDSATDRSTIWVNGALMALSAAGPMNIAGTLSRFFGDQNANWPVQGKAQECSIWVGTALTPTQIGTLYACGIVSSNTPPTAPSNVAATTPADATSTMTCDPATDADDDPLQYEARWRQGATEVEACALQTFAGAISVVSDTSGLASGEWIPGFRAHDGTEYGNWAEGDPVTVLHPPTAAVIAAAATDYGEITISQVTPPVGATTRALYAADSAADLPAGGPGGGAELLDADWDGTDVVETGLGWEVTRYYREYSTNAAGTTASNLVSATTDPIPLPGAPTISPAVTGVMEITITTTVPGTLATDHELYMQVGGTTDPDDVFDPANLWVDDLGAVPDPVVMGGATPGETFRFGMLAINAYGSTRSAVALITMPVAQLAVALVGYNSGTLQLLGAPYAVAVRYQTALASEPDYDPDLDGPTTVSDSTRFYHLVTGLPAATALTSSADWQEEVGGAWLGPVEMLWSTIAAPADTSTIVHPVRGEAARGTYCIVMALAAGRSVTRIRISDYYGDGTWITLPALCFDSLLQTDGWYWLEVQTDLGTLLTVLFRIDNAVRVGDIDCNEAAAGVRMGLDPYGGPHIWETSNILAGLGLGCSVRGRPDSDCAFLPYEVYGPGYLLFPTSPSGGDMTRAGSQRIRRS